LTKVEFRELQRGVAYLRRMAEELVDECCSFEADIQELHEKSNHRKNHNKRYAPLMARADVSDKELDSLTPELRRATGYEPEPIKATDKNCA
jgi:multidrug resistance efflux pump